MSRKALKSINWSAIAERVVEADRPQFVAFKTKSDQYLRRVTSLPESVPKIDWAYYKKNVPVAGLVDKFQKEYEALSIPYPADTYTSKLDALDEEMRKSIEEFKQQSDQRIKQCETELERIKNLIPVEQMTMEEFAEAYPDQAVDAINRPSIWPHVEEVQPEYIAKLPKEEHH